MKAEGAVLIQAYTRRNGPLPVDDHIFRIDGTVIFLFVLIIGTVVRAAVLRPLQPRRNEIMRIHPGKLRLQALCPRMKTVSPPCFRIVIKIPDKTGCVRIFPKTVCQIIIVYQTF